VIFLLLGGASLLAVMAALGMFSSARVSDIKQFGVWTVAIGGLLMAALLFLTGRGAVAMAGLVFLGPLLWSWLGLAKPGGKFGSSSGGASRPAGASPNARPGAMTRAEALDVLGLPAKAGRTEIQAAYIRLMRAAHPDHGGSDWIAARINQARDVLLG
jgi:DnaJ family protein C protein 19